MRFFPVLPVPSGPRGARRLRLSTLAVACSAALSGCWFDSDDVDTETYPQLAAATPGTLATCDLSRLSYPNTTFTAATSVAAGALSVAGTPVGAHCLVTGRMFQRVSAVDGQTYAIGFEMRLPQAWNGRFFHQVNGGTDGVVVQATGGIGGGGPLTNALQQGFAVISSDAGHNTAQNTNGSFGVDPQARLDYGYQAVQKLTPMAKTTITVAYGRGPDRSYLAGCSNGGRHALVGASRFADQYDGILAGAPGYNLPKAAIANIYGAQRYATVATNAADISTGWTAAERQLVSNAVLAKCDALDGATDGLVQDTTACQAAFRLDTDVPTCTGARNGTCLSAAQKTAIGSIFAGAKTSTGAAVYSTFPYDSGHGATGVAFWEFTASLNLDPGAAGIIFGVPPESPTGFNPATFALNANIDTLVTRINATNATYTESALQFMTPPDPSNLSTLRNRGGKLIVYHGVSDAIFSVDDSTAYINNLNAASRGGDASAYARFYRVPGMGHCSGGPATDQFNMVDALVKWVEQGQRPGAVIASARGAGNAGGVNTELPAGWSATRTRPLCPYPQVARYKGSGSVEDAANFECRS